MIGAQPTGHDEATYRRDIAASIENDQNAALAVARALTSKRLRMPTLPTDIAAAKQALQVKNTLGSDDRTNAAQSALNDATAKASMNPKDIYSRSLVSAWQMTLARARAAAPAIVKQQQSLFGAMHARQRPSGTWTVDGGGKPGYFPGGEDPMLRQPLTNCAQRGEAFMRGGLQGLDEEIDNEGGALDCFGADDLDYVGFEYMDLAKAGTGLLSGFGGMFSRGGGGGGGGAAGQMTPAQAAEKQRLEDEKKRAEQSATNMKIALGVTGGVGLLGVFAFLLRR